MSSPWQRRVIPYRYITMHCPRCVWPFQCPEEQKEYRLYCRACEHKGEGER